MMKGLKRKINRVLNAVKGGRLNTYYYNKCLKKYNIDEKSILLVSQQGKDINGNMFYLMKELNLDKYNDYSKYVAVDRPHYEEFDKKFKTYGITNCKLIIIGSREYMKILATAKYLFNDTSFLQYFVKRDEQVYFNTWHGTPFKTLGKSIKDDFHLIGNPQRNFLFSNYLLYPNEFMRDHMIEDYMLANIATEDTKVVLSGYPRNEIFFDDARRNELKEKLGLKNKEVIMYMPTWRGSFYGLKAKAQEQIDEVNSYLSEIDKSLKKNQVMFVNFHPFLKDKIKLEGYKNILPFDKAYETYDFLNMADILITDYSSVFFDFAVTKRKIILFAYDKEEYFENRGTYFGFEELPFAKVYDVKGLIKEINNKKNCDMTEFLDKFCKYESIDASKKICDLVLNKDSSKLIIEPVPNNGKKNVLIYSANLNKNGITSSLLALLHSIDLDKYNYYLTFIGNSVTKNKEILWNRDPRICYIPFVKRTDGTIKEKLTELLYKLNLVSYKKADSILHDFYKTEIKRKYGNSNFDHVIQYSGYGDDIIRMFAKFDCDRSIYIHSNMIEEAKLRKNQRLRTLKNVYKEYDNVVVVNEKLIEPTATISGTKENIININNAIDYNVITEKANMPITFDEVTESNKSIDEIETILKSDKKKIISVGRFSPEKGYDRLIDAFNEVNPDAYLIIIGGFGPLYNKLIAKVNETNSEKIILIKNMSNPFTILKQCDNMIISSFYEGLPMVIFEAMVLGKPIISTDVESIKQFFKKYNGGKIVENSVEGLKEAINISLNGNIPLLQIDFKEYNNAVVEKFENLVEGKDNKDMNENKDNKLEELQKELKRKNKKLKILTILISLMILAGAALGTIFVARKVRPFNKIYNSIKLAKNIVVEKLLDDGTPFVENYHNAAYKLDLESAYGDNQGTHTKVLYFENGWNGYKYWMTYSPYPKSDDSKENPHIKVSNDKINWTEPEGFKNPLEDRPSDYENMVIYYSDPHLVYNSDTDTLECYFRRVDDKIDQMILYRMTTKDGVNWTPKEEILKTKRSVHDYVSPAIIYEDHMYKVWYVNKNNTVTYEESKDGYNYTNSRVIPLKYKPSTQKTWHLDVIHTEEGYEMITVAFETWNDRMHMNIYYFFSKDNENWTTGQAILKPSSISWDNGGMYRSSLLKIDGTYYLYYSALSQENIRGIGLSYGNDIFNLKGSNIKLEKDI